MQRRPWLTRNLVVLTLVSLTQDAASELMFPLLPLLLTGVLAAPPVVLGVVEGLADATAGVTRYVAGRWSDRRGRKPFIAAGYSLAAIGKVLVAAAGGWPVVMAGRVVDRFGKGIRSAPRDALIAASVAPEHRGRAFGFHRAGDTLGAVIGPLLALAALAVLDDDLGAALWWAVVPAVLSAVLVVLVSDPHRTPPPAESAAASEAVAVNARSEAGHHSALPPAFWRVTTVLVAIAVVNFSDVLLLLRLSDIGFDTTEVVLGYVLFNLVYTLGSYPAGVLADRWPRHRVYAVGLVAFAVGYLGLGAFDGGWPVLACLMVYGLFPAFTDGVGKAWVASLVPRHQLGRAQGTFQALQSGAVLAAGAWAGLLWTAGPGEGVLPLVVAGAVAAVAAVGLATWQSVPEQLTSS